MDETPRTPPSEYVQTVCGTIHASDLGTCYGHEHLLGAPPADVEAEEDFVLDDEQAAVAELERFRRSGGSAIVEMSTADYGRNAVGLRRISQRAGVHIVCATGYNKDRFSARLVGDATVDMLARRFIREIVVGIGDTGIHAGVVKAASTLNEITTAAEKVFRAAARTHLETGAPISTHTEAGTMAIEQLRLLGAEGVRPDAVVIGHMDRKLEPGYHREVAATGAYLSFDQIGKVKYYADAERAEMIVGLVEEGFGGQILLGGDLARRSYWPAYGSGGGPGFAHILERFVPLLREVGMSEGGVMQLLVDNPARAFAFRFENSAQNLNN